MKKSFILLPLLAAALMSCGDPSGSDPSGSDPSGSDPSGSNSSGGGSGEVVYNFSSLSQTGVALTAENALSTFEGAVTSGSNIITGVAATYVYDGAGSGGAYADKTGMLKLGKSTDSAVLTLTLSKAVKKVVVNCFDFYAKTTEYSTNSNSLALGSDSKLFPYSETASKDQQLTWDLATATTSLEFTTSSSISGKGGRGYIFAITITA